MTLTVLIVLTGYCPHRKRRESKTERAISTSKLQWICCLVISYFSTPVITKTKKRDPIIVGHNMKRCATEHDHTDNDVRQATNQVGFGGPLCSWREMEAAEFLPDGQRVGQTPHSGSISPSTPSPTGSQTVAKSRLAGFVISTSNGRGLS